jgi:hypothetical protein
VAIGLVKDSPSTQLGLLLVRRAEHLATAISRGI